MTIVFCCLESISQLPKAIWIRGNDKSYEVTQRLAESLFSDDYILLVGREDKRGGVEPVYARNGWAGWCRVSDMLVRVAQHFAFSPANAPAPREARMIVESEVGGLDQNNISDRELHAAISNLQNALRAVGVDLGDISYNAISAACGRQNLSAAAAAR